MREFARVKEHTLRKQREREKERKKKEGERGKEGDGERERDGCGKESVSDVQSWPLWSPFRKQSTQIALGICVRGEVSQREGWQYHVGSTSHVLHL